jgi:hypothetical protein
MDSSTIETVQAFMKPAEKLIDAVSSAIGKAYEPKHIRKMADAKAYEIKMISEAVRNNSDIPIIYDSTGVTIDTSNYEEIAKRASSRLAYQEIAKQQNIEAVVDNAYEELKNDNSVSTEPVNADWMIRFFNSVEDISDEIMQKIWGHILAGEVRNPNSYSYRTLEKLKNMTRQEAEHFQLVASLALQCGDKKFILSDNELMNKYNVYFSYILELEECGLMSSQRLSLNIDFSNISAESIYNSQIVGIIKEKDEILRELVLSVHIFTNSGKQLITAIHPKENSNYILDCLETILKDNRNFVVTAHNINYIEGKVISCDDTDILKSR